MFSFQHSHLHIQVHTRTQRLMSICKIILHTDILCIYITYILLDINHYLLICICLRTWLVLQMCNELGRVGGNRHIRIIHTLIWWSLLGSEAQMIGDFERDVAEYLFFTYVIICWIRNSRYVFDLKLVWSYKMQHARTKHFAPIVVNSGSLLESIACCLGSAKMPGWRMESHNINMTQGGVSSAETFPCFFEANNIQVVICSLASNSISWLVLRWFRWVIQWIFSARSHPQELLEADGGREKNRKRWAKDFDAEPEAFIRALKERKVFQPKSWLNMFFFWMMNLVDWWWTDDVWLLQTSVTQKMRALWTIDITEIKRYAMSQDAEGSNPKIFFSCLLHGKTAQDEVIRRDHDTFTMAELNLIVPGWRVQSMWVAFWIF